MKYLCFLATLIATAYSFDAQTVDFIEDKLKAEFTTSDDKTTITVKLTVTGISTSSWTANTNGIWMGVGWDTNEMSGADLNSCKLIWTGSDANSVFTFNDWSYPAENTNRNFKWTETQNLQSTSTVKVDKANGEFSCQFTRKIDTGDSDDIVIPMDKMVDVIGAYGFHLSSATANQGYQSHAV